MNSVFVLQHLHVLPGDVEDWKMIGVYRSKAAALAAIDRLKELPGFRDAPRFVDPHARQDGDGFYIDEYELDEDQWTEGFFTAT